MINAKAAGAATVALALVAFPITRKADMSTADGPAEYFTGQPGWSR
jgi:hypothetical protein